MKIVTLFGFFVIFILFPSGSRSQVVDSNCIRCLCLEGCIITEEYWSDAGEFTVNGDNSRSAFRNCRRNYDCSTRTIQSYMERFNMDCNRDGRIDCTDHSTIHRFGPQFCRYRSVPQYYRDHIQNCLYNG